MARQKYDEDDLQPDAPRNPWRRRLLVWALALVGLGLGFLVPYTLYLNSLLDEQFAALTWQEPTRVYARPLMLAPGLALDARTLRHELQAAGYREGDGVRPGTWNEQEDGGRWLISSHGFRDVDGPVAPSRVEVRLAGGRVSGLHDADGEGLDRARLDPARIATLYGARQEERRMVQVEDVPVLLTDTLQAVEDRDFAHHRGIDLSGMARAAWVNLRAGSTRQGGSTLTQQLARSGLFGIGREQTWTRKFNEIIYALLIEARHDKGTIMETYLNQVYLGQRGAQAIRGVAAGAEFWFGRRLEDLDAEHVALLVGMIRGPSYYDPRRHPERARERRDFALAQMHSTGLIDEAEYRRALAAPLGVSDRPGGLAANRFPAYVDLVRQQLASHYDAGELQGAGLSVMTAMSPSAQGYAEGAVRRTIQSLADQDRPELQAALVLTDVHNGEVLAVVGNRDPLQHGFNRAIEAKRPVGSLLKPFVYLLALAMPGEWSLASPIDDSPVTVTLPNGQSWTPVNANRRSHGVVPLMDALASSYNQATVRLGMRIDPRRLAELIGTLAGIEAEPNPSLILGSLDQSPYAMAQLYQFLASGGEFQALRMVRGVINDEGVTVNRYDREVGEAQAGDAVAVRLVTLALQRAVTSGTARQLVNDGLGHLRPAGKTGTSNDGRDSWFAGWTGDHLAVVWMGNDQNEATGLYGATGAMRVWSDMFSRLPSAPLTVGEGGLDWRWVAHGYSTDADCPQARRYAFVPGFAPAYQPCHYPDAQYAEGEPANDGAAREAPASRPARRGWRSWFGLDEREPDPPPPASRTQEIEP
ncbi:penicillin-binding protein 1B [Luteimonas sp. JM171]|uniref:penicillin-binding protein 1B n=1 Tax=Luteimonas sp. JM171 TaxID=1896164 RepID=UPI0008587D44|nr:penicillin-binding protein 1B [Luteimonas sp. JM171]AOH35183.1 penicillin-binding protein 1B [Luteimonas sp. JM171]